MSPDPAVIAALLFAYAFGVMTTPALIGIWLWVREVRAAVREGTPIDGAELERNRKRENSDG